MKQRVAGIFLFFISAIAVKAQMLDSVQSLAGVEIFAGRKTVFSTGMRIEKFDSTTLSVRQGTSIATLLAEQTAVSIRSYSPGGIATLTLRGTNSTQSGVFWNGINLEQPNMGMTDLSRISSFEFNDITLQSGGASALLGSGVIGGSLHLSNSLKYSTPLISAVMLNIGTAGKIGGAVKISAGSRKAAYTGSLFLERNKNNFWYTDLSGDRVRLDHALAESVSSVHQVEFLLNQQQKLSAGIWYQETDRQIPPTMTMSQSTQHQWDRAVRSSLSWSYTGSNQSFFVRTAYIDEKERYSNKDANIDTLYHLNTYKAEFEYKRSLGTSFSLGSGITGNMVKADVPYYQHIEYQPGGALWLAVAYTDLKSGIRTVLNIRKDVSEGYKVPLSPSLGTEVPLSELFSVHASLSRSFRVPSMNDKYWIPGGNPNLKPEESWNLQAGLDLTLNKSKLFNSKINLDVYALWIDNLIQWVPGEYGIWTAQNVQKVLSRGVEVSSKTDWKYASLKGYFKLGYNFTPSVYKGTSFGETEILGNQLIYIPLHKVQETFFFGWDTYYAMFTYSVTGKRYVQSDNQNSLPAYSLLDAYAGTSMQYKKLSFRLQIECRNIFNASYQSVLYYPEPGRAYSVSLIIINRQINSSNEIH